MKNGMSSGTETGPGLTRLAFHYRPVTYLLTVLLMAVGLFGLFSMPRREDPDFQPRFVRVLAYYPGASAAQVEELVTQKIERSLREIDDVGTVESTSRPGVAILMIEGADRMTGSIKKWQDDIRHRVSDLRPSLPPGVVKVETDDRISEISALIFGISRPDASSADLERDAKRLRDRLVLLPEVSEAKVIGEHPEVITVTVSSQRLSAMARAVTVDGIANAIGRRNILPHTGGDLPSGDTRLNLAPTGDVRSVEDLESTVVGMANGAPVYLRDVAVVRRGYADPPAFLMRVNGERSVGVTVTMRKGRSIAELGERAEKVVHEVESELPSGTTIRTMNNLPRSVEWRVEGFFHELRLAVGIIAVVMFLFMGLRSSLLVGAMLPISMLGTFAAMWLTGREIQQMSIAALIIALALVVDNSIVILDNIEEKMSAGQNREEAAILGAEELTRPMISSNLVAILSFLPLAFLPGPVGDFVKDLGIVTALSLVVSVLINLTIMPILCLYFLKPVHGSGNPIQRFLDRGVDSLREGKASLASWSFRRPGLVVGIAAVLLLGAVSLIPKLGQQFFPLAERDQFVVDVWLPEGRDIAATARTVTRVENILRQQKGITGFASYIGQGGPHFYYNIIAETPAPHYAQIIVNTENIEETARLVPIVQAEAMRTIAEGRVNAKKLEQGPPIGAPIALRISGESVPELRRIAEEVRTVLNTTPGAFSVYDNYGAIPLQMKVDVDQDRAAAFGLSSAQVAQQVRLAFTGQTVSYLRVGDREIPIDLRLRSDERQGVTDPASLYLISPTAGALPIGNLARIGFAPEEGAIIRRDGERTVTVFAYSDGSRLPSVVLADARERLRNLRLPAGYRLAFGGESEETGKSFGDMIVVFSAAMVFNVVILVVQFNSFPLVLAILSSVPLGIIGAVPGLYLAKQNFGFMAFLGIAALGGIVTNHTVFLFHYAQEERRLQGVSMAEALVDASRRRLRPILLTVLLSVGALLPQAISGGNLWPPLDWAIISGLMVSTFLTMIVVPSVYALLARREIRATEAVLPVTSAPGLPPPAMP
ncbi:MAG: efflux RND transporter permease subunit [Capsulimonadales bacterium]|nr:efflux RND transporter permease subunit [Capsulimonadales bacterium]